MRVVVAGGIGFIGRHVVKYLITEKIASKVLILDKVLREVAGFDDKEHELFFGDQVVYKQLNLAKEETVREAFKLDGGNWEYVINSAATTKYSQPYESYSENIVEVARVIGKISTENNVKRLIHLSTGQVYDSGKKPRTETAKIKPWTSLAKASVEGEEIIKKEYKNAIIVRPAIVYGPGDTTGITPRLIMGAVYQRLDEKMELLWSKELRINTVHVSDVSAAIAHLLKAGEEGDIYNLADSSDSSQGSINEFIKQLFGIKIGFLSAVTSKLATGFAMKTVADTANEKHLLPWGELLKEHNINNSPITPYLDEELLYNNSLGIDGSKITSTGFTYSKPNVTLDLLKEVIQCFEEKGMFPKGLLKV